MAGESGPIDAYSDDSDTDWAVKAAGEGDGSLDCEGSLDKEGSEDSDGYEDSDGSFEGEGMGDSECESDG